MTSEQLREERIARLPKGSKPGNKINRITHISLKVDDIRAVGDGSEIRAKLTRL